MYFTNNFRKLQRIYTIFAIILMISYTVVYFLITEGDFITFIIALIFIAFPAWYTQSLLKQWSNKEPIIIESVTLSELTIGKVDMQKAIERLLTQQRRWRVKERVDQKDAYSITLDTPITFYSLGEIINITARFSDISGDVIEIESKPKIPVAEFDNGRNKDNVNTIKSFLSATLQSLDKAK